MHAKYSIDSDIDTLLLAELKKLALVYLKVHETNRKNSKAYYDGNREACIARSTHVCERHKTLIATRRASKLQETQGGFDFTREIEFPGAFENLGEE